MPVLSSLPPLFSEAVTDFEESDISVTGTGALEPASLSAVSSLIYTFNVTYNTDGESTLSIPADSAYDNAGNGNEVSNDFIIISDTIAPTIDTAETNTNGSSIILIVSEPLIGTASTTTFTILNNTVNTVNEVIFTQPSNMLILEVSTTIAPNTTVTLSYDGTTLTDFGGNALTPFTDLDVTNNVFDFTTGLLLRIKVFLEGAQ